MEKIKKFKDLFSNDKKLNMSLYLMEKDVNPASRAIHTTFSSEYQTRSYQITPYYKSISKNF